jgi:hypothetical protein
VSAKPQFRTAAHGLMNKNDGSITIAASYALVEAFTMELGF